MAGGWVRDDGVQNQIDASIEDAVAHARQQMPEGVSREFCEECRIAIPEARRKAVVGVRLCIRCQMQHDKQGR